MRGSFGAAVIDPGWFFRFSCVITLVGGTMFLMWIGEQITARGVGNGTSLIIMAGIVANLPNALASLLDLGRTGALSPFFIVGFMVLAVFVIAFIVFIERAQRRIAIQYPEAPGRQPHVRRRLHAHAAEDQHLGRDPADLRQLDPADPGDHRRLLRRARPGLAAVHRQQPVARHAALHGALRVR